MDTAAERAIELAGGLTKLADLVGVKPSSVFKWRVRRVPAERVLAVERATGGKVTRHELRPDLYPPADAHPAPASAP
ncbi:helix-turn-helix domain-containing protein [Roseomonas sp. NAR14]|uniref:Helix-turn-helix domain-containing protein n=1 Tax=Roseomonas acroporae TaxID=2937791 RepID=A0A9X1YFF0_9PROT|nr:helix-turn-helix domain-containing protein [Roseomonas acroporae]MCK8785236.1 helix-turn-helix domain-containing protein [Roseomonas acroporae]